MFRNFKLGRKHVIGGIFALIILITGISMLRISYNEGIVDAYDASTKVLPERTKIGVMDRFWQKYTGGTRNTNVTQVEAQRAERAIDSAYGFMVGADVILILAAGILILQPIISKRISK